MANNKNIDNYEEKIRQSRRDLIALQERRRRDHDHKPNHGGKLMPLHESKINVPGKRDLPDSTIICTKCEKYFEGNSYLPSETDSGLYMFGSMIEQIKLNAQLTEEDWDMINQCYDALDTLGSLATYYNDMVEKLANNSGNKKGKGGGPKKGYMGINSSMFGGRNY